MHKNYGFVKKTFDLTIIGGDTIFPLSLRLSGINFYIFANDRHTKPYLALLLIEFWEYFYKQIKPNTHNGGHLRLF